MKSSGIIFGLTILAMSLAGQEETIQFRQEQSFANVGIQPKADQTGQINRVTYRFVSGVSGVVVERQPVLAPDPQKGTLARPKPVPGAPWVRETVDAPLGAKPLAWGDFDNDGSDELLTGWPGSTSGIRRGSGGHCRSK